MANDIRLAARLLRKNAGLSAAIILLLGFGIGANAALFQLVYAILLRPIPGVQGSQDLIRIRRTDHGRIQGNQSYPDYLDFRDRVTTLQGLVAERLMPVRLPGPPAQLIPGAIVTGNYFQVLGVQPAAGRLLLPEDDRVPGEGAAVVISESFWQSQFARNPSAIGASLILNGYPFTVIGIAAAPFEGVEFGQPTSIWMPMAMVRHAMTRAPDYHWLTERRAGWLTWYGRLKPGVRLQNASAELSAIARRLETAHPDSNAGRGIQISDHPSMDPEQRASLRSLLGLLSIAVCLVLLIACGNAANLLLARTAARAREMAIRLAIGASRSDLFRQMLAESLLLGLAGGLLGLVLAPWIDPLLRRAWNPRAAPVPSMGIDLHLAAFTLGISLATAFLFGLAPAWAALRTEVGTALKQAAPQAGRRLSRLQRIWVIAQVTLSVALVATAFSVLESMHRILGIDPGYRPERILSATMDVSLLGYSPERGLQFFENLLARTRVLSGVHAATLGKSSPAVDWSDRVPVFRPGGETAIVTVDRNIIAPDYFRTLSIPLIAGRDFTAADRSGAPAVAIVSRGLANRFWPGQNALGKRIMVPVERRTLPAQVIGVVADSRYRTLIAEPPLLLYSPLLQNYDSIARLIVAVDGDPAQFKARLRHLLAEAAPGLPVRAVSTMQEQIDLSLWERRSAAALLSLFGALALALACAGIYGVVAYAVARQSREIGIRMALGADRTNVVRTVLTGALRLTGIGILFGVPLALATRPLIASFLYGASATQPWTLAAVCALFLLVTLAASFMPARGAATVDPALVLRQD
ncbi:MAG: ABC transporter permease [Bryobacteraceae bacterium]